MTSSPFVAFAHLKETLVAYLETAYKISHPDIFLERQTLLERPTAVVQPPYIETTPGYPSGRHLREIVAAHLNRLDFDLVDLLGFGTPLDKKPLWVHQDRAIEQWCGSRPNLVVATGTASGKTEIFLIPIMARILKEAQSQNWLAPTRAPQRGSWDRNTNTWQHSRRHERRTPGVRAIILYPTNALVNDQLRRLRRILASEARRIGQKTASPPSRSSFGSWSDLPHES